MRRKPEHASANPSARPPLTLPPRTIKRYASATWPSLMSYRTKYIATVAAARMAPQMIHGRTAGHVRARRSRVGRRVGWSSIVIECRYRIDRDMQASPAFQCTRCGRVRRARASPSALLHLSEPYKEVVQRFSDCWMRKNAVSERGVRKIAHHGELKHAHDLAALQAEYGAAQNVVCIAVDDRLHETAWLRDLDRARHVRHGHGGHRDIAMLGARLSLGESDTA